MNQENGNLIGCSSALAAASGILPVATKAVAAQELATRTATCGFLLAGRRAARICCHEAEKYGNPLCGLVGGKAKRAPFRARI